MKIVSQLYNFMIFGKWPWTVVNRTDSQQPFRNLVAAHSSTEMKAELTSSKGKYSVCFRDPLEVAVGFFSLIEGTRTTCLTDKGDVSRLLCDSFDM